MPKETKENIVQLRNRYTEFLNDPRNEIYRIALGKILKGVERTPQESEVLDSYIPIISPLEEERCRLVSRLVHVPLKQLVPEITTFDFEWIMDNVSKIIVSVDAPYENLGSVIRCKRQDLECIIEETFGGGSYNVEIIDCTLRLKGYDIFYPPGIYYSHKIPLLPIVIEGMGKEGAFIGTLREWGIIEAS